MCSWGGTEYPWASPTIIGLAVAGTVLILLFIAQEFRAPEPLLPPRLFRERIFTVSSAIGLIVGATMFGAIAFLPIYLQIVKGVSATSSGLRLVPLMLGLVATSVISGRMISNSGRYRKFPIAGMAIVVIGLLLMSRLGATTGMLEVSAYMFVLGIGVGMVMQVIVLAAQNAADYRDARRRNLGSTLFRQVGGSIGVSESVAVGVMILAWPGISVYALTIVFGAYTLATGIVEFGTAFTAQGKEERGWLILRGLLGITVGVLVFAWPGISALALLYVIGAYAVGLGILAVAASFQLPLDGRDTTAMVLTGLASIVFGIVIFAKPGAGALAVLALIAAFALVTGVSELVVAIGGEKLLERKAKKTFSPPPTQAKTTPQPSH